MTIPTSIPCRPAVRLAILLALGGVLVVGNVGPAAAGDIGGDDILAATASDPQDGVIAIGDEGDIFITAHYLDIDYISAIQVYRSRDGGDSWQEWGRFAPPGGGYQDPSLHIAGGVADRCFLAFTYGNPTGGYDIEVAWLDLDAPTPDWTRVTVATGANMVFTGPCLTSDQGSYADYVLYLVFTGWERGPTGRDLYFARSTDQGLTWESPYVVADNPVDDSSYLEGSVSYGFGDHVHVAWTFRDDTHVLDRALLYRRAGGRAAGGIGAWGGIQTLTTSSDGMWDDRPQVAASAAGTEVMIAYNRFIRHSATDWEYFEPGVFCSHDAGAGFATSGLLTDGLEQVHALAHQGATGTWIVSGQRDDGVAIQRADEAAPLSWSVPEFFSDDPGGDRNLWWGRLALDPSHADRVAVHWLDWSMFPQGVMFDAEWLSDPGFPSLEPGFPVALDHAPVSAPALVDLDGDGMLEIVYGDDAGRIQVRDRTGASLAGWPVDTGHPLSDGPVAVGALTLGGEPYVVAGTTDGYAVAYLADGTPAPGWPTLVNVDDPVYVSIGALGGPFPRTVVCCAAYNLTYRDYRGEIPDGATPRIALFRSHAHPAAIGDIDDDGVGEVVVCPSDLVAAYEMRGGSANFSRTLPADVSDAPTLGDLDLDGDLEIVVPCSDGNVYVLEHDGSDHPGWPVTTVAGPPTSVAIAQILHGYEPDLVWADRDWTVEGYYETGARLAGVWPWHTTTGFTLGSAPVLDTINDQYSDAVIGDPAGLGWAWTNVAHLIPDWPKAVGGAVDVSPALGDVDLDGSLEAVFLADGALAVVDVHNPPSTDHFRWPMYAYDPRRTGCHNCPEDVVTAVPGGEPGDGAEGGAGSDPEGGATVTRVSFAAPSPNPMSGPGFFRFAVPVRCAVSLEVLDLRGRRVRTVLRREVGPGPHEIGWDGRDRRGDEVAAGQYVARLTVRGPGLREQLVRKVVRLR